MNSTPKTLRVLSAGAAQAVTERIIEAFELDTSVSVTASFGAVGAMKARVTAGESVDVITLTRAMMEELAAAGLVAPGSRFDLGTVGTGVAVRVGAPHAPIASRETLRSAVLAATKIVCPDPAAATAGKIVMSMMEKLGVVDEVRSRMQFFPNGYAAMTWLAASGEDGAMGITQVTEILPNKGVTYLGPLPDEFQMKTVYSAGVAAKAIHAALARDFVGRFAAPTGRAMLLEAGYELEPVTGS